MSVPNDIITRLTTLEIELYHTQLEVAELEKKVSYYDKMAVKWGGACMGAMAIGALVSGSFDKLREKLIGLFP